MLKESYVVITTAIGLEQQVLNEIKTFPEVKEIYTIHGVYDLLLRVQANNIEEMKDIVGNIRRNRDVKSLLSLIVVDKG